MREEELRTIVRDVLGRRLAMPAHRVALSHAPSATDHPSHARFRLPSGGDADGPCLIEPSVACVHCGYCQSQGH